MDRLVPNWADVASRRAVLAIVVASAFTALAALAALSGCSGREPAPRFSYTLLDGARASTDSLRGKVVLVNFWATSCTACVNEMPQFVATHRKFQARGLETLAVAMRYDAPASVSHFAQDRQLPFGVVIDNTGAIAQAFAGVQATPTTYVIDKRGAIVQRIVGKPDFHELHLLVGKLLTET